MPSATFTLYNQFKEDCAGGVHDLFGTAGAGANTCKWMLSNTAPNVTTHAVRADVTELATSGGYTSGGTSAANVGTRSTGTFSMATSAVTFTGSSGGFTARYAILYNDTPTSPADPLIGYLDYGSSQAVAAGEDFTIQAASPLFTLA